MNDKVTGEAGNQRQVKLQDIIDVNFLQQFQDNFAECLGMASLTVDVEGNAVTQPSNSRRQLSSK
ncbi:hypothetical protein SPSIL_030420 [Sporomusa silvacetica DSM 10669]|uniref:PocR domain-containing protein n=1 Tax=Sporomusa silvacetica DSM 10669 TaxID=1123289 RepID=A0ABZ3IMJ5_9FIRM|nr:PocR ligand-binding domain-containing protein [Sporomusa silvacetica]OZC14401.1 putative histidine kinase sensor domain protein [Sporomusa silvacetica DSM 10669]